MMMMMMMMIKSRRLYATYLLLLTVYICSTVVCVIAETSTLQSESTESDRQPAGPWKNSRRRSKSREMQRDENSGRWETSCSALDTSETTQVAYERSLSLKSTQRTPVFRQLHTWFTHLHW